ncbi:MAG: archaeosortase/exosortase family protein, partial [Gemmatimonadales bacterium]
MVAPAANVPAVRSPIDVFSGSRRSMLPVGVAAVMFVLLFASPARGLVRDWFNDPDAGQGLLLFPVALWLAWRSGILRDVAPDRALGSAILLAATLL